MKNTNPMIDNKKLGVVQKYIFRTNINGAHDSLLNTKTQTDIIKHASF